MSHIDRIISSYDDKTIPSLFPYQIKNRNAFYDRDHPKNINPSSLTYHSYWSKQLKKCIEGRWVDDNGTWVYMPGKLHFYINISTIADEKRKTINPRLRDNEWIIFYYLMIVDGFSGFEGDDEFTCHDLVKTMEEDPDELDEIQKKLIPKSAYREDGDLKKYMYPWEYLTRHYLFKNDKGKELGHPLWDNMIKNGTILSSRGLGKEQPHSEAVLTKNGWSTMGEISIGDYVIGQNGKPIKVLDKFPQGVKDVYEITLRDGRKVKCGLDHLWKVWDNYKTRKGGKKGDWVVKSTKDLISNYSNTRIDSKRKKSHGDIKYIQEYRYFVPLNKAVENSKKDLPIDPYLLGLWLGDGSSHRVGITSNDEETVEYLYDTASKHDHNVTINENSSKTCPTYHITKGNHVSSSERTLHNEFKKLNVFRNKHIPSIYLESSIDQRLSLLQGLMDSDGTCSGSCVEFYNKNKRLSEEVLSLARSLGIYAQIKIKEGILNGVSYGDNYRVTMKTHLDIFRLKRKLDCHKKTRSNTRYGLSRTKKVAITSIKKLDYKEESSCIMVDSDDHTYLTTDYVVTHNSFSCFVGDFLYEFLFNGKKRMNDDIDMNGRSNFAMGSSATVQLDRSIANVSAFYNAMPGQYKYPKSKNGKDIPKSMGPFYKRVQGAWKSGSTIEHIVKNKDNTKEVEGSMVQMVALTADKNTIASGDRFLRIYCEEQGFQSNLLEIFAASVDSLRVGNEKVGAFIGLGTGGNLEAVRASKTIFEAPEAYDSASIPNYWKNINKRIGMFIPRYYADENYKDENGNTLIELSYNAVLKQREKIRKDKDSVSYDTDIMFNPIQPDEMLRPSSGGFLPKQEAAEQLSNLESWDIFQRKAMVGSLQWSPAEKSGVRFNVDFKKELNPILDWNVDMKKADLDGAFIVYEQPPERIPQNLYWVMYDPAAKSGAGESLHSIIVYKGFWSGNEATMSDTIVAEWIGRLEKLDDNYDMCVKVAKYFNALIFPEINIAGFAEYMSRKNLYYMLESDAYLLEREISPKIKRGHYKVGFQMSHRKKLWCLKKLRDWLMEVKDVDPITGVAITKGINHILSPRILDEIINYNDTDNFDHISSLLGLMLLLGKIDREVIEIKEEEDDELKNFEDFLKSQNIKPPSRASFLNY